MQINYGTCTFRVGLIAVSASVITSPGVAVVNAKTDSPNHPDDKSAVKHVRTAVATAHFLATVQPENSVTWAVEPQNKETRL